MSPPTISQICHHVALGGLWLVIPALVAAGQPRPIFAQLGVTQGPFGPVATFEGGDLVATIESSPALQGAQWVPVTSRGERT